MMIYKVLESSSQGSPLEGIPITGNSIGGNLHQRESSLEGIPIIGNPHRRESCRREFPSEEIFKVRESSDNVLK